LYADPFLPNTAAEKGKLLVAAMSKQGSFRLNVFIDTLSLLNLMQHTSFSKNNSNDSQLKYLENPGDDEVCTSLLESFVNIMKSNNPGDVLARAEKLESLFYVQRTVLGRQYRSLRLSIGDDDQIQNVWIGEHVNGSEWILNRSSSERNRVLKQGISTLIATCIEDTFLDHDEVKADHLKTFKIRGTEHTVNLLYLIAYRKRTTTLKAAYDKFYKLFKK
jgi:F0F1-type ATP synthase delta subunit